MVRRVHLIMAGAGEIGSYVCSRSRTEAGAGQSISSKPWERKFETESR